VDALGGQTPLARLAETFRGILLGWKPWEDYYPDKFRARRALMLAAVNAGWTLADCTAEFLVRERPGSELWASGRDGRELAPSETLRRLERDYHAAAAKAASDPAIRYADEARQIVGEVKAAIRIADWRGVAGRTDRAVLEYVCQEATRVGSTAVCISARSAAEGAGCHTGTAARSLGRLVHNGWLVKGKHREFHLAQEYRLLTGPQNAGRRRHQQVYHHETYHPEVLTPDRMVCLNLIHPGHETWVRLGKSALALWQVLDVSPLSARELARRARVSPMTAVRNLPKLAAHGLARCCPGEGWSFGPLDPDAVADHMGWHKDESEVEYRRRKARQERDAFRALAGIPETLASLAMTRRSYRKPYRLQCERVFPGGKRCKRSWQVDAHNGARKYCPQCSGAVKRIRDRRRQWELAYSQTERRRAKRYERRFRELVDRAKGADPELTDSEVIAAFEAGELESVGIEPGEAERAWLESGAVLPAVAEERPRSGLERILARLGKKRLEVMPHEKGSMVP
jgi:hypothetical protein